MDANDDDDGNETVFVGAVCAGGCIAEKKLLAVVNLIKYARRVNNERRKSYTHTQKR